MFKESRRTAGLRSSPLRLESETRICFLPVGLALVPRDACFVFGARACELK